MREEFARDNRGDRFGYGGQSWMSLLRSLTREEILDVLSDGFCHHCEAFLENRIRGIINDGN